MMRAISLIFILLISTKSYTAPQVFNANNLAIGGVDVVAYFTNGKPVMGDKNYTIQWQGASWQFANQKHLEMFKRHPDKFVPQYGGFCSLTTAHGASIPSNPNAWAIYQDRLYLFVFESARDTWLMNPDQLIERANLKWSNNSTQ